MISLLGLNLFVGPALALGIPLLASDAGWGAQGVGILEAAVGLGAALGALAMLKWRPGFPARTGFAFLVLQGLGILALAIGNFWAAVAACLLVGVTAGVASSLLGSVFAATVEGSFFGRMVSIQRLGDDVFMPLAMVGFGALAATTSVGVALAAFGLTMAGLMCWPLSRKALRDQKLATSPTAP